MAQGNHVGVFEPYCRDDEFLCLKSRNLSSRFLLGARKIEKEWAESDVLALIFENSVAEDGFNGAVAHAADSDSHVEGTAANPS